MGSEDQASETVIDRGDDTDKEVVKRIEASIESEVDRLVTAAGVPVKRRAQVCEEWVHHLSTAALLETRKGFSVQVSVSRALQRFGAADDLREPVRCWRHRNARRSLFRPLPWWLWAWLAIEGISFRFWWPRFTEDPSAGWVRWSVVLVAVMAALISMVIAARWASLGGRALGWRQRIGGLITSVIGFWALTLVVQLIVVIGLDARSIHLVAAAKLAMGGAGLTLTDLGPSLVAATLMAGLAWSHGVSRSFAYSVEQGRSL